MSAATQGNTVKENTSVILAQPESPYFSAHPHTTPFCSKQSHPDPFYLIPPLQPWDQVLWWRLGLAWGFSPTDKVKGMKGALAPALSSRQLIWSFSAVFSDPWVRFAGGIHNFVAMTLFLCTIPVFAQSTNLFLPETNSTITIRLTPDKQSPEDFRSILIHSADTTTRIVAKDQIIRIPATRAARKAAGIWSADTPGLQIEPSRFFLIGQYTADAKPHTLLFFLSDAAASDAAPILIIGFSDEGKPSKIFEQPYELSSFEQADEGALITGKASVSQAMCDPAEPREPSSTTYDPYSVFLVRPGHKPLYLLNASRVYNRKHYIWAGPHSREDYAVIRNLPGHPKLFGAPAAQLDQLLAGVNCTR